MTRLLVCNDAKLKGVGKVGADYSVRSDLYLVDISKISSKIQQTALSLWVSPVVGAASLEKMATVPKKQPQQIPVSVRCNELLLFIPRYINSSLRQPGSQIQVSCFSSLPPGFGLYLWMKRVQWFLTHMAISEITPSGMRLEVHRWVHMRISTPVTYQNISKLVSFKFPKGGKTEVLNLS